MSNLLLEIESQIAGVKTSLAKQNIGVVREIGDGVAKIEGLTEAMLNEMIDFGNGVIGLALNLEETEVTTDIGCLRRLCESSGGRLLEPRELTRLFEELNRDKMDATPKTLLKPIWNVAWVFYAATLWFGLDWFLPRRWGLC